MPLRVEPLESRVNPIVLPADVGVTPILDFPAITTSTEIAPDGRIFFTQKDLGVRVIKDGKLLAQPFAQLSVFADGEQGVSGLTLDPNFQTNGFVYVYYTYFGADGGPVNRVSRLTANGDTAVSGSEVVLLQVNRRSNYNHAGGALHFGPDGKLYIAVGDHNNPPDAQSLDSLTGKVLRINKDGSIPADNPFVARGGVAAAIWAYGFRNPFTFSISQRTGRLFVNDVGSAFWEELNEVQPGGNYGWPTQEGPAVAGFVAPLYTYPHNDTPPNGFAITGALWYEPETPSLPDRYDGRYFFGEYTNRFVSSYDPATGGIEIFALNYFDSPIDMDVDPEGNLIVTGIGGTPAQPNAITTRIYKFRRGGSQDPSVVAQPADAFVSVAQPAVFSVTATGAGGLSYQWQKNGIDIPGANAATLELTGLTPADDGALIRVTTRNAFGAAVSRAATLRVTTDLPPAVAITSPSNGTLFSMGDTVAFTGTATDPETGALPAESLSWTVEYFTNGLARPFAEGIVGPSGEVTLPTTTPYTKTDVFYRLTLTARDTAGLVERASIDLQPRLTTLTLESEVPNAALLDGRIVGSGETVTAVAGVERELSARREVIVDGGRFVFMGWSDSGERTHTVKFTELPQTIRASYMRAGDAPRDSLAIGGSGTAMLRRPDGTEFRVSPFEGFTSSLSVASADVNGDGTEDLVVGAGPGGAPLVVVFDGNTGDEIGRFLAFEASFRGGVFVAAGDLDDDGVAELVASPDRGGGPVVAVFGGAGFSQQARFFGIDDPAFRGGARVGVADLNGDGPADLLVAAGTGGGPRIAVFDGSTFRDSLLKLVNDFFAFEPSLRNGAYIAGGDVQGDGTAEVVVGGGPGGAPRVRVLDGTALLNGGTADGSAVGDFFAGDPAGRSGARVAARDLTGDGKAEVVTGVGRVAEVFGPELMSMESFEPFPELGGGVFVG